MCPRRCNGVADQSIPLPSHASIASPSVVAYTQLCTACRGSTPRRCYRLFEQLSPRCPSISCRSIIHMAIHPIDCTDAVSAQRPPSSAKILIPLVRTSVKKITLVLRSFEGVAYTCGSDMDKEIHLSLDYVVSTVSRARDEIIGVLVHEVVHCYQYNAKDTCPGGFIEGIAGRAVF